MNYRLGAVMIQCSHLVSYSSQHSPSPLRVLQCSVTADKSPVTLKSSPPFAVYSLKVLLAFLIGATVFQNMTGESQGFFFFKQNIPCLTFFLVNFIPLSQSFFCEKCSFFFFCYLFVLLLPARSLNFPCKSCESCCLQCISFPKVTLSPHSFSLSSL